MFELSFSFGFAIIVFALCAEYIDSTLGMGYGTALTPILLILGFDPLQVVPAVLLSELVTGLFAGFTHHSFGNVNFKPKTISIFRIIRACKSYGIRESASRGLPRALKVTLVISCCSVVGSVSAVFLAVQMSPLLLKTIIGILILIVGIVIIITAGKEYMFSWKRILILGVVASFNKGLSGGGYGPVVTGGQLISGVDGKNAIAITSVAEGLTCLVGIVTYLALNRSIDLMLAPYLLIGALISVPISAFTVKHLSPHVFKPLIGAITAFMGGLSLFKVFFL